MPSIPSFRTVRRFLGSFFERLALRLASMERERYVLIVFFIIGAIILETTLRYTVSQYSYWKALADRQQTIEQTNPVSRGEISSQNDPPGIFATSTSLPDLAVDPGQIGSREKLVEFLTDIVFDETCSNNEVDCYANLLGFLHATDVPDYTYDETSIRTTITKYLTDRLAKKYVDYATIAENISDHDCAEISLWNAAGVTCINGTLGVDPTTATDTGGLTTRIHTLLGTSPDDITNALQLRPVRYLKIYHRINTRSRDKIQARIDNETEAIKK